MRFAVAGDIHGQYRALARHLAEVRAELGELDFVLAVGDAEPNRDEADAAGVAGPEKYRILGEFPEGRLRPARPRRPPLLHRWQP